MKIAIVHNYYQQRGGEEQVFAAEGALLEARGHTVVRFTKHNDDVARMTKLGLARATIWNGETFHQLRALIRERRVDIVHAHNTLPLISPSIYDAAWAEGIPVVQTLHNYRISCVNAQFFREGRVCEDCLGRPVPWLGVLRRCYRNSGPASAAVATMLGYHKTRKTYTDRVCRYIALTPFAKTKYMAAGLPSEKLVVKPNFLEMDPGQGEGQGGYALFVGRLSAEKGISTLLDAWELLGPRLVLKVAGDGPESARVKAAAAASDSIEWLGWRSRDEILTLMRGAQLLVFPSVWYEGLPMTIIEAFATGLPVVASNLGAMESLIDDGRTGLHFEPGGAGDLATKIAWALEHPVELSRMRAEARSEYEAKYTAERNYEALMSIYEQAIGSRRGQR